MANKLLSVKIGNEIAWINKVDEYTDVNFTVISCQPEEKR